MLRLPLTRELSSLEEMTWKLSVMCYFTLCGEVCLGKVFRVDQRMKNMLILRRRKSKLHYLNSVKVSLASFRNSWNTVGLSNSNRTQTMITAFNFSVDACNVTTWTKKCSTLPGSKTDWTKTRRLSKQKWWTCSKRIPSQLLKNLLQTSLV